VDVALAAEGADLTRAIEAARTGQVDVVVAGGGDGTVSAIAAALAGTGIPLGVLPLGTLNHFARDMKIPVDLDEAVAVVIAGHIVQVDVGEVNGSFFLNNSSLGLYPRVLRLRQQHPATGWKKWLVALWATIKLQRHHPNMRVRIEVAGRSVEYRTPVVFIGNNEYEAAGVTTGIRKSLVDGKLAVYIVRSRGRPRLLRLGWRMFTGKVVRTGELDTLKTESARIDFPRYPRLEIEAALDGELMLLTQPLEYRTRPGALSVLVPAPPSADSQ
jgi:diacylglycerol kinase family enzyme